MKRFFKCESGATAVEAVFILPFLCVIYFSLQDFTSLVTFNRKLTATSSVISDTIAQYPNTIASTNIDDIFNAAILTMSPSPIANVHVDVYDYATADGVTVTKAWTYNNKNAKACTAPTPSSFAPLMSSKNDLVVVVSCMTYTPWVTSFIGQQLLSSTSFNLSQTIAARPRASTTLACSSGCS